jgi:hypothetical protein
MDLVSSHPVQVPRRRPGSAAGSRLAQLALTGLLVQLMACASSAPPATGTGIYPGPSPTAVCQHYLACVAVAAAPQLGPSLEAYGSTGTCWKGTANEQLVCASACASGLKALHNLAPTELACAECRDDLDCSKDAPGCALDNHRCSQCSKNSQCRDANLPACDTAAHQCVACTVDSECMTPGKPACHLKTHECAACSQNSQCPDPGLPACDTNAGQCVACMQAGDCHDPALPSCNPASHTCVQCAAASQCQDPAVPACDLSSHSCVECLTDVQCKGDLSVCDVGAHACVGCLTTSDCGEKSTCVDKSCCKQQCTGKSCGPDGCGGQCGTCGSGGKCSKTGKCSPCMTDLDCGNTQVCYTAKDKKTTCFNECDVFSVPSNCGSDQACNNVGYDFAYHIFVQCGAAGTVQAYESCNSITDCEAGTMCLQPGYCAPFCDTDHPCKAGHACVAMTFDGTPQKYSTCKK